MQGKNFISIGNDFFFILGTALVRSPGTHSGLSRRRKTINVLNKRRKVKEDGAGSVLK